MVGVGVGITGVAVGRGVLVGIGVGVAVGVAVGVGVSVMVGVAVGVGVDDGVNVAVGLASFVEVRFAAVMGVTCAFCPPQPASSSAMTARAISGR